MIIVIPEHIFEPFHAHLFQNELEQGAFFFGTQSADDELVVDALYTVPASGWEVQLEVYLEMKDRERSNIMRTAVQRGSAIVDCHSHPGAADDVWFSPSDITGIRAFAQYAKWKLRGKPYIASVWGERSVDAVVWQENYQAPTLITEVRIVGDKTRSLVPTGSWLREPRAAHRKVHPDD